MVNFPPLPANRPYIVAELGTSHAGDPDLGRRLIDAAGKAGADAVKAQWVVADEILHPESGFVPLPGGPTPLYEVFKSLERPPSFYEALRRHAEARGLGFFCSVFGPASATLAAELGMPAFKVASPEVNHFPLLAVLREIGRPVLISTGVTLLGDIEACLDALGDGVVALLHCVTAYPAPPEDYNLKLIPGLAAVFGLPVGLSDHSTDPILVPTLATLFGARVLEKHLTLDRSGAGLDDPVALDPTDFGRMCASVKEAANAMESNMQGDVLARLESLYGGLVAAASGDGVKRLAASEAANYERTRRSIHVCRRLVAGHRIERSDLAVLRTEKRLRPGLDPRLLAVVVGAPLRRDVESGEGLVWRDILGD